ncbi:hypothetical protein YC2023_071324 [Brassica napus]
MSVYVVSDGYYLLGNNKVSDFFCSFQDAKTLSVTSPVTTIEKKLDQSIPISANSIMSKELLFVAQPSYSCHVISLIRRNSLWKHWTDFLATLTDKSLCKREERRSQTCNNEKRGAYERRGLDSD